MNRFFSAFLFSFFLTLFACFSVQGEGPATLFQLSGAPLKKRVQAVGCDIDPRLSLQDGALLFNCFNFDPSFGPRTVWSSGSVVSVRGASFAGRSPGSSSSSLKPGFWAGASLFLLIPSSDGSLQPFGPLKIKDSKTLEDGSELFTPETPLPQSSRGALYSIVLKQEEPLQELASGLPALLVDKPGLASSLVASKNASWSIDQADRPQGSDVPPFRLKLSLKDASSKTPEGLKQAVASRATLKALLPPNCVYKLRLRAKVEASKQPVPLSVSLGDFARFDFQATPGEWFDKTFEAGPRELDAKASGSDGFLSLLAAAPCELAISSVELYRSDAKPFELLPERRAALAAFAPGSLRLWNAFYEKDLASLLGEPLSASPQSDLARRNSRSPLSLSEGLTLCSSLNAAPWLVLDPLRSENDFRALAEYLGAPADVGYGRLRSAQGHPKPWLDELPVVFAEISYEPWNQACLPLAWPWRPASFAQLRDYAASALLESPYVKGRIKLVSPGDIAETRRGSWTWQSVNDARLRSSNSFALQTGGSFGFAFAPTDELSKTQARLLHPSVVLGRQSAYAKALDADNGASLFAALSRDETAFALCVPNIWTRNSRNNIPDSLFAKPLRTPSLASVGELLEADQEGRQTPSSPSLRSAFDRAFLRFFWDAVGELPSESATLAARLEIPEPLFIKLSDALTNFDGRRLGELMKGSHELADALSSRLNDPAAAKLLSKSRDGSEVPRNIVEAVAVRLAEEHVESSGSPGALAAALLGASSPSILEDCAAFPASAATEMLWAFAERRADLIAYAMRRNPAFARIVLKSLASDRKGFAEQFVKADSPALAQAARRFREELSSTLLHRLPSGFSAAFAKRLRDSLESMPSPDSTGRSFAASLLAASFIDARSLDGEERRLAEDVAAKCMRTLADCVVQRMGDNAHFARIIDGELARSGSSPGLVYELGPRYENGPSGKSFYSVQDAVNRSPAVALGVLDASLSASFSGFSSQSVYRFGGGEGYASSQPGAKGWLSPEPLAFWRALQLRNAWCKGAPVEVEALDARRLDVLDSEGKVDAFDGGSSTRRFQGRLSVQLEECWAFKDGSSWTAVLVNRSASEARQVSVCGVDPKGDADLKLLGAGGEADSKLKASDSAFSFKLPPCSAAFLRWRQ